ncbi:MAG TPA: GH-E family nuclease [Mycobacteriales bacterium]|nr:GH-E family nuclease [Mycobacteriales bacterium]
MLLRAGARTAMIKTRIAVVVAAVLVAGTVTGSGGPAGPAQAPAAEAVAFTPNCSAADSGAGVALAGGRPRLDASGAAYQARLAPAAATAKPTTVAYAGAKLVVGPRAAAEPVTVGITPLTEAELPELDPGMSNVTEGPQAGYRFTPHPYEFTEPVEVSLPYDAAAAAAATSLQDVFTFYYDEAASCWRPLERVAVDEQAHTIVSRTDHFTDMINATVTVPDLPEGGSFDPTQIKGIQAGDPGAAVSQIATPGATNAGDARLGYPIQIPPGRAGMQPNLGVSYSSAGGNSWLGMGWDVPMPAITVDTRWGVPRYNSGLETETYLMGGQQLSPVAHRGPLVARSADKVFHTRIEGGFQQVVRHGATPADYSWEVTDKSGTRYLYGGTPEATLADDAGHIFQWALREVRDLHNNFMRYQTVRQADLGVPTGGSVPGRALYPKQITYTGAGDTDGPYTVTFIRDRELGEPRRPDVTIDARGGFKRVTADLLRRIEVKFNGALVRKYELAYQTGAFGKTLLRSVSQFGEDGRLFNTHTFDYFDDIRDAAGAYQAFGEVAWNSPDDNLRNGAVATVGGGAGEVGALGGSTSTSVGGHLYVGFGVSRSKSGSVGVKAGFSEGEDTGLLALVDVDGDNLPDKVFRGGGGVVYRKNLSTPTGQPRFADSVAPLRNLPGILSESSSTLTVGVEAYPGPAAIQLDHVDTVSTTDRYFTDVNGDGISDLVNGGGVLFGRVGPDGAPVYGLSADTPVPVGSAPIDAGDVLGDFGAARERQIDSHPLIDSVRRWVAPFDGTVRVDGPVRLVQDTSPERAAYTKADGVRVAIQHEGSELFALLVGPTDYTPHTPDGVGAIAVHRGDRLYFRVQSRFDGAFDQVAWDPQVSYVDVADPTDVNGLSPYRYRASTDFTLGGRASTVAVPVTGTLHLSGALTKPAVTTDDVTAVVTRNGATVFTQTLPAAQTGQIPVDADIPVERGQQLQWRIQVDSPIDLARLDWTPVAEYTAAEGVPRLIDENGNAILRVEPPYVVDMYPVDTLTAPQQSFTAPASGTLMVVPSLAVEAGDTTTDGRVVFTVKRRGALLGKQVITITDGQVPADLTLTAPVEAGDELFFDFSTLDPDLATHLAGQSVQAGFDAETLAPVPSALHSAAPEGAFPQPYRGWAAIGYNGNRDRATAAIAQGDLVVDEHYKDQLPTSVDPQRDQDAFAADPRITPPKFVQFAPAPADRRWEAGDASWITGAGASSSRLGGQSVNVPTAADFDNVTGVPRVARSTQISLTGSVGGDIGSIGGSIATGDSTSELDYLDLNGDRFPDLVGSGGVQYTDPTGQLGGTRGSVPDGAARKSHTSAGNVSAGSAARTIATGRGNAAPTGNGAANTSESGNDMPPLGVGGSHGTGSASGTFDLLDINGDGLPDRVYADGRAALNLGYRFAAPEPWPGGPLNDGRSTRNGLNIGFNTDFYGFAGGASFSSGRSTSRASLADVNGDGLVDRVFEGSPLRVALNTGTGFAAPVPFFGGLSGLTADVNSSLGGGAYFTFSFCFLVIAGCVIVNPGADVSTGASRSEQALRDINGDGFADQLRSTKDSELVVAANRTGRTNLLKSVRRPLGSRIDLDYARDGNTYDQPESRFVLSRVAVDDGRPGDGQDVQLSTYRYAGGVSDRLEREFRGYRTVVTEQRDRSAADAVFRTITAEYRTDSHYTQGLLARQVTADGAGRPFTETENTYDLRDVDRPTASADPASTSATIFPQLVRTDQRFYEGQPTPAKSTHTDMSYDDVGNLTRSLDVGEPGPADDVETKIRYSVESGFCRDFYLLGTPQLIQVRGGGVLLRQRESTVECRTGDVVRHRALLADGTGVVTDFTHFDNGNVESVTYPPNAKNQRYRVDYQYDPTVSTYPTLIKDIFGLQSTSTYNLKYGRLETSTDQNNQVLRQSYDTVGRLASVVGPREAGDSRPTIAFEYHPEAAVPYAVTRHADREADGRLRTDTIDTIAFADGLGRIVQTKKDATVATAPGAAAADVMTVSGRSVFDSLGRAVEQTFPITEPKGAANTRLNPGVDTAPPTRVSYDILDRPLRTVLADGSVSSAAYGFGADRAGVTQLETAVTDAKGNVKRSFRDVRQQITAVREANPAGNQPTIWTSYDYDPLGQIVKVTDDHGNLTTSAYDNLGRRTVLSTPDTGRTETVYDRANNPVRKITAVLGAAGQSVEYDHDFTRMTAVRYPTFPANNVTYTYGAPGAAANGAGRVVKVDDAAGSMAREYGQLGEITKETRTVKGVLSRDTAYTTQYRYDSFNRMLQLTYPDGEVLSYRYNSGGLVDKATGVKAGHTYQYLKRLDYDKFEQRLLLEPGNGTKTTYTYGAEDRRLTTLESVLPHGETFQNQSYEYDDVGNITATSNDVAFPDHRTDSPDIGGPSSQTFGYDDLYRLTSSQGQFKPSRDKTDAYQVSMAYDSVNNITTKNQQHDITDVRGLVPPAGNYANAYAYAGTQPHAPSAVGPLSLRYDANGNLISRTDTGPGGRRRQQVWDEENRLACTDEGSPTAPTIGQNPAACEHVGHDGVRFIYDAQGERVVKDAGSSSKVSIYPSQTFSQRGGAAFKHIFIGPSRLVSKMVESDHDTEKNQFYFHPDHLGSTAYGTDEKGRLVDHQQYFPSGETWVDETRSEPTPYQFSGKELDTETGLYYFGARYYDPVTSVWQSADPIVASYLDGAPNAGVYSPVNLSAYTYADNRPTVVTDPTGEWTWSGVAKGAGYAVLGGAAVVGTIALIGLVSVPAAAAATGAAVVYGAYTGTVLATELVTGKDWDTGRELTEDENSQNIGAAGVVVITLGAGKVFAARRAAAAPRPPVTEGAARPGAGAPTAPAAEGAGPAAEGAGAAAEQAAAVRVVDPAARRVPLRVATQRAIQDAAPKTPDGDFIDPNTGRVVPRNGPWDYGHKPGFEWWRTQQRAREEGWTRRQVIEYENDPAHYQIEDRGSNRGHRYEMPRDD